MLMNVVQVNSKNIALLQEFINNIGDAAITFRYFNKRKLSEIRNHLITLLFTQENKPVAYGHLENVGLETWLGLCIAPAQKRNGLGMLMMEALIQKANQFGISTISLTVDKVNEAAINLYEKNGFIKVKETDTFFKYQLQLI